MPNGHESVPEPELERLRERLTELDQARDVDDEQTELEFQELQESYRQLTGEYYDLPTDRDV